MGFMKEKSHINARVTSLGQLSLAEFSCE